MEMPTADFTGKLHQSATQNHHQKEKVLQKKETIEETVVIYRKELFKIIVLLLYNI